MLVVFGIVLLALVFFVLEPVPIDVTAIGIIVVLVALEPWTTISPEDGVAGFSSPATVTVLAMFIISEGVRRTGVVQRIGDWIVEATRGDPRRQLAAVIGLSGGSAGFINNTPVVAIMIPMVMNIAKQTRTSPSKLLLPVSFASMMGGTLTLIGTSTNILASDVSARLLDRPFSMFEFTALGVLVLVTGVVYLLLVADRLIPERIQPEEELIEEYEMADYLTEVLVREDSPLVGMTVERTLEELEFDGDIVQVIRHGEAFIEPLARKELREGDVLMLRTDRATLVDLIDAEEVDLLPEVQLHDADLERAEEARNLVEVVVLPDTALVGETLNSLNFRQRYDATVLAIRRGGEVIRQRMDKTPLRGGDTLLIQAPEETITRLDRDRAFVVADEIVRPEFRTGKLPIAIVIVAGVVALAALEVFPILITALAGVVAMVATGCLRPTEMYEAVDWNVIFLLAGVIPLGVAMERTGGAEWIASLVVSGSSTLPAIAVLGVFYLLTALLTNVVSNNASVVLMIPVAVDAAAAIGANAFSFVLAVTFAASTAFITPIGYQTNLMVYGPGGYRFSDFARLGAPLQLLLAVVTTLGIAAIWGV
ncbi:SLC13 family permease [Halalkalicoccus ordinarius]|uniref:SLC13 family permease n=1 Tax=Halalkalicoccus ordinarius TaxID=3116651 RepID=UPI00300EEFDC